MATTKRDFAAERYEIILIRQSMLIGAATFLALLIARLAKAGSRLRAIQSHLQRMLQIARLAQQRLRIF